jgi:hypothetical protein
MQSDIKSYERTLKRMNQYDNTSKDPIERVKGTIEAICLKTEIYDYDNTQELLELFDDKIEHNKKQYINPTAFIFGFFVTTGNKIDKKKINEIFKKYNNELVNVELVDIIRYARFWLKIKDPTGQIEIEESKNYDENEFINENVDDENEFINEFINENVDDENEFMNENVDDDDDYNGAAEYKASGKYNEW